MAKDLREIAYSFAHCVGRFPFECSGGTTNGRSHVLFFSRFHRNDRFCFVMEDPRSTDSLSDNIILPFFLTNGRLPFNGGKFILFHLPKIFTGFTFQMESAPG